jgi:quercetin dioxygenase-like cupin family protein
MAWAEQIGFQHGGRVMFGKMVLCAVLVATCSRADAVYAQQLFKITPLQSVELPDDKTVARMSLVEDAPNGQSQRHFHSGLEFGYVLGGSIEFQIGDQAAKTFNAGDSFTIPANAPHVAKTGPNGVRMINMFYIEKDKPLATTVP